MVLSAGTDVPKRICKGEDDTLKPGDKFYLIPTLFCYKVEQISDNDVAQSGKRAREDGQDEEEQNRVVKKAARPATNKVSSRASILQKIHTYLQPKTQKPPCKYGSKCYNKDSTHLNRFSHPCKYGEKCYRREEKHFLKYNHPWDYQDQPGEDPSSKVSNDTKEKEDDDIGTKEEGMECQ